MGTTQSKPATKPRRSSSTKDRHSRSSSRSHWSKTSLGKSVSNVEEDDSQSLSRSLSPSETGWDDSEYEDEYRRKYKGRPSRGVSDNSSSCTTGTGVVTKGVKEVKVIRKIRAEWGDDDTNQTGESKYERQIIDGYFYTPERAKPKWKVELEEVEKQIREGKEKERRKSRKRFGRKSKILEEEAELAKKKQKDKHPVEVGIEACKRMGVFTVAKKDLDGLPEEMLQKLPGSVSVMDLSHNRLTIIPSELCKYVLTARFSAAFNRITAVPAYFGKMTGLRKIDLSHNQIEYIPDELFRNMRELEELDLSDNQLTTLPSSLFKLPKLLQLTVSKNRITTLPGEISSMKWLMNLDISSNLIQEVPEGLAENTQLRKLVLDDNKISTIPSAILFSCTELRTISVQKNPVKMQQLKQTPGFDEYVERCLQSRPKYMPRDEPGILDEYVVADP